MKPLASLLDSLPAMCAVVGLAFAAAHVLGGVPEWLTIPAAFVTGLVYARTVGRRR